MKRERHREEREGRVWRELEFGGFISPFPKPDFPFLKKKIFFFFILVFGTIFGVE